MSESKLLEYSRSFDSPIAIIGQRPGERVAFSPETRSLWRRRLEITSRHIVFLTCEGSFVVN